MTAKKAAAAAEVSEKDEASALGRKAYGEATKALREKYRDEFDTLLDEAYAANGMTSPRIKRVERAQEAAEKKAAAAVRREERRLAKVAALKAELAALEPTLDEGDPIF